MKIHTTKGVRKSNQGFLTPFVKAKPLYYDDNIQKIGIDYSDLIKAVDAIQRNFARLDSAITNFATGFERSIKKVTDVMDGFVKKTQALNKVINLKIDTSQAIQNTNNLSDNIDKGKRKLKEIGEESKRLAADLANIASGGSLEFLKSQPTNIVRASIPTEQLSGKETIGLQSDAYDAQKKFQKVIDNILRAGKITQEQLKDIFSSIDTGKMSTVSDLMQKGGNDAVKAYKELERTLNRITGKKNVSISGEVSSELSKITQALKINENEFAKWSIESVKSVYNAENELTRQIYQIRKTLEDNRVFTQKITIDAEGNLISKTKEVEQLKRSLRSISEESQAVSFRLANTLFDNKLKPRAKDPTDIVRAAVSPSILATTPKQLIGKAYIAQGNFQKITDDLLNSGRLTARQLEALFEGINTGRLDKLGPHIANAGAVAIDAYAKLERAIGRIISASGQASNSQIKTISGIRAFSLVDRQFAEGVNNARTKIEDFKKTLTNSLNINDITKKSEAEYNRYLGAILKGSGEIRKLDISPKELPKAIEKVGPFAAAGAPHDFSGSYAKLYDILRNVAKAADQVGVSVDTMRARLRAATEDATASRNISNQFKGLVGNVPTGVSPALETSLSSTFNRVGIEAHKVGATFEDIKNISSRVVNGVISDWDGVPDKLGKAIERTYQLRDRLTKTQIAQAPRLPDIPQVRQTLEQQIPPAKLSIATSTERVKVEKDIEGIVKAYTRLDDTNVSLSRFVELVSSAMNKVDIVLRKSEISIHNQLQKFSRDLEGLGSNLTNKQIDTANLSTAEQRVVGISGRQLGQPLALQGQIHGVDIGNDEHIRNLFNQYKNIIKDISKQVIDININDSQLEAAFERAKQGGNFLDILDVKYQTLVQTISKLIAKTHQFGDENEREIKRAIKDSEQLATAGRSSVISPARITAIDQIVREGAGGRPSLVSQLRPRSGGGLPTHATEGDVSKIQTQLNTINNLLSSNKVSLQEYDRAISIVSSRKIVPSGSTADFQRLTQAISSVANQLSIAENRANSFNKAILTAANAVRLAIVSELFSVYSSIRGAINQSLTSANQLSIQIALIKSITQDAKVSTDEWAESLRRISDVSGKNITEVSVAAYNALSNQITRTKSDTEEFLNTAVEFGRTVGATPTQSVDLLSSAINAFGGSANDAKRLSAEFFATIDVGRIKVQDLQNIYGRAALAGERLGASSSEMSAALAVLTQNGLTTEDAVTRLNNLFVKLLNPTKEMRNLFSQLGVTSGTQLIALRGFAGAIQTIESSIKNGNVALEELFPEIRTLAGFLGLSGNNAVKFSEALDYIANKSGEAYEGAKKLTELSVGQQLSEEFERLKNVFTVDFAGPFLQNIVSINNSIGGLSNTLKRLETEIGGAARTVAELVTAWLGIKIVGSLLASISTGLYTVGISAINAGVQVRTLSLATRGADVAAASLNATFFRNPVLQVIAGAILVFETLNYVINKTNNSTKELLANAKKIGEEKFNQADLRINAPNVKLNIDTSSALSLFNNVKNDLSGAFTTAFSRINIGFESMIRKQEGDVKRLAGIVETSFSGISNLLSKAASAIESSIQESSKIQRTIPVEDVQRQERIIEEAYKKRVELVKEVDQAGGIHGISGNQVEAIDDLVNQYRQGSARLYTESIRLLKSTFNTSEADSIRKEAINKLEEGIKTYVEISDQLIKEGIQSGRPLAGVATASNIFGPRIEQLKEGIKEINEAFSSQLKANDQGQKAQYRQLRNTIEEANSLKKDILDFNIKNATQYSNITTSGRSISEQVGERQRNLLNQQSNVVNTLRPFNADIDITKAKNKLAELDTTLAERKKLNLDTSDIDFNISETKNKLDALEKERVINLKPNIEIDTVLNKIRDIETQLFDKLQKKAPESILKPLRDELDKANEELFQVIGKVKSPTVDTEKVKDAYRQIRAIQAENIQKPIVIEPSNILKSAQQQTQEQIDVYKNKIQQYFNLINRERPTLEKFGELPAFEESIKELQTQLGRLLEKQRELADTEIKFGVFKQESEKARESIKAFSDEIHRLSSVEIPKLNESLKELFGDIGSKTESVLQLFQRIQGSGASFKTFFPKLTPEYGNIITNLRNIENLARENPELKVNIKNAEEKVVGIKKKIDELSVAGKPIDIETKNFEEANKELTQLYNQRAVNPETINSAITSIDRIKESLTTIKDFDASKLGNQSREIFSTFRAGLNITELTSQLSDLRNTYVNTKETFSEQLTAKFNIEDITLKLAQLKAGLTSGLSPILTESETAFKTWTNNNKGHVQELINSLDPLKDKINEINNLLRSFNIPQLAQPNSPIGGNLAVPKSAPSVKEESVGGMIYYNRGGQARGTDTHLAMINPKEYIMPQDKTEKYLPILERMRGGTYLQEGGQAQDSYNTIYNLFSHNRDKAANLAVDVYATSPQGVSLRQEHVNKLIGKGYPRDTVTPAAYRLYSGLNYKELPVIQYGDNPQYDKYTDVLTLPSKEKTGMAIDRLAIIRHEMEHKAQSAPLSLFNRLIDPIKNRFADIPVTISTNEIPPALGDLIYSTEVFRQHTGKQSNLSLELSNKELISLDQMANQAKKYGFFRGRTTTELLATPSGQAYLKRLLTNPPKKVVSNYEEGGEVENLINTWRQQPGTSINSINRESLEKLSNIFLSHPTESYKLSDYLYEQSVPRKEITKEARRQLLSPSIPISKNLLQGMWEGQPPNIHVGGTNLATKRNNSITISKDINPITIDQIGSLSHELEHSKQPSFRLNYPHRASNEVKDLYADMSSIAKEIPPSIGDIVFTTRVAELVNKKPLYIPVNIAPNVSHSASWMANQAEQHGYFQGRSMTELLATPSGQAYTKRLLNNSSENELSKLRSSNKYDWNWTLINDRMQTEPLNKVLETLYNFKINYHQDGGTVETHVGNLSSYWKNLKRSPEIKDDTMLKLFASRPQASFRLSERLHDYSVPRKILVDDARKDSKNTLQSSARLISGMYKGSVPNIKFDVNGNDNYSPEENTIHLSRTPGRTTIDQISTLRHEMEHTRQNYTHPIMKEQDFWDNILNASAEIPASLGDIPFIAQSYKLANKKALYTPVPVTPNIVHSADWMSRQAEQHGFFKGRTTTELLSTPSGQAYTNRLLDSITEPYKSETTNFKSDSKILDLIRNKDVSKIYEHFGIKDKTNYYAKGGWTYFEPRGTDTIPAMLTPGEYVMPRDKTDKYIRTLHRMREGSYPVEYYDQGGDVLQTRISNLKQELDQIQQQVSSNNYINQSKDIDQPRDSGNTSVNNLPINPNLLYTNLLNKGGVVKYYQGGGQVNIYDPTGAYVISAARNNPIGRINEIDKYMSEESSRKAFYKFDDAYLRWSQYDPTFTYEDFKKAYKERKVPPLKEVEGFSRNIRTIRRMTDVTEPNSFYNTSVENYNFQHSLTPDQRQKLFNSVVFEQGKYYEELIAGRTTNPIINLDRAGSILSSPFPIFQRLIGNHLGVIAETNKILQSRTKEIPRITNEDIIKQLIKNATPQDRAKGALWQKYQVQPIPRHSIPSTGVVSPKYTIPNVNSTSTDNSQTTHVTINVSVGDASSGNIGRRIGTEIKREIRRGNLNLT